MKRNKKMIPAVVGCLVVQLCVGILYLWSVFRTPIVDAFSWSDAAAKMVSSYMIFAFVLGNLIGGVLNDKRGAKFTAFTGVIVFSVGVGLTAFLTSSTINLINVTYAVLGGLGSGIAYGACISCVQKWMPDKRGLASGLAVSAFGLSTVIFTPVSKWLMDIFTSDTTGLVNFRPVFLILAGVFFVLGIIACIFMVEPAAGMLPPSVKDTKPSKVVTRRDYTLGEAIKTAPFWCLFFSIFFINGTWNLTVPLIYNLGVDRGLTAAAATFAVSFTGIPNALGRLIMATVSDKIGRTASIIILSALTLIGAVLMVFVGGYAYIAVVAIIAFAYGGPSAINAAMSTDYFGSKNSGTNYGVIMTALGFSSVFFNAVSNKLLNGAVTGTFIMAAITAIVPIILMKYLDFYNVKNK